MKIIFAGTPFFATAALRAIAQKHEVLAVLTQPDRPAGRGMKVLPSAVKSTAEELHLPVWQPETLKQENLLTALRNLQADAMVVVAYGLLVPKDILESTRYGCLNIHASLLPRWRGAAPIQRAIEAGDQQTGICIMQMDEGLDTGDVLLRTVCPIDQNDTTQTLHDKLMTIGADSIVAVLQQLPTISRTQQSESGITYAKKISKNETRIDWNLPAQVVHNKIRALNPAPGAWTTRKGGTIKIWQSEIVDCQHHQRAGEILQTASDGIVIATMDKALKITELQLSGSKKMVVSDFLRGNTVNAGEQWGD